MKTIDYISNDLKLEIIKAMSSGQCTTIDELMTQFDLNIYQATQLMSDSVFLASVANFSKAESRVFLHSKGFKRLRNIADGEDDKASMQAIKMLAEYTGDIAKKSNVDINISLEQQIRNEEAKQVSPSIDAEFRKIQKGEQKNLPPARPEDYFDINEISNDLKFEDEFEFVN